MKAPITILLFIIAHLAVAQTEERHIAVTGSSEMELSPNIIVLSITLGEYDKMGRKVELEDIERRFLQIVTDQKIEEDKIVVSRISSYAYRYRRNNNTHATKTYDITFNSHGGLTDFTSRLWADDIQYMYINKLSHTDVQKYRLEVKKDALKAARDKAEELLSVYEAELGEVISIQERSDSNNTWWSNRDVFSNTVSRGPSGGDSITPDEIGFRKIKLRYEMDVKFQIR